MGVAPPARVPATVSKVRLQEKEMFLAALDIGFLEVFHRLRWRGYGAYLIHFHHGGGYHRQNRPIQDDPDHMMVNIIQQDSRDGLPCWKG